jgi:hypothetical protein
MKNTHIESFSTESYTGTITIEKGVLVRPPRVVRQNKSLGNLKVSRTELIVALGELVDLLTDKGVDSTELEKYENMIVDAQFNNPVDLALPSWWDNMRIHAVSMDGSDVEDGKPWLWATLHGPRIEKMKAAYTAAFGIPFAETELDSSTKSE